MLVVQTVDIFKRKASLEQSLRPVILKSTLSRSKGITSPQVKGLGPLAGKTMPSSKQLSQLHKSLKSDVSLIDQSRIIQQSLQQSHSGVTSPLLDLKKELLSQRLLSPKHSNKQI